MDFWKNAIIYQIYPKSFNKNLKGIADKLNYLKLLGVNAIWLNPIYPSGGTDGGYDIIDYYNIDPIYGDLDDFNNVIQNAHQIGIKVLMDLVINHTSIKHPWFQDSMQKKNNKEDWYLWVDQIPENWKSEFEMQPWSYHPERGQFYYHYFYHEQPDLNLRHPEVKKEIYKIIDFWINKGVDGFRMDAVSIYFYHPQLKPYEHKNLPYPKYQINQAETYQFLKEMRNRYTEIILLGETETYHIEQKLEYLKSLNMIMNYDFSYINQLSANKFRKAIQETDSIFYHSHNLPLYYLNNHDRPRCRYGEENKKIAKLMATLLLMQNGVKIIYYGEELGLPNGEDYKFDRLGRDICRSPIPWDKNNDDNTEWIPVQHHQYNVTDQLKNRYSVLSWYQRCIVFSKNLVGNTYFMDQNSEVLWFYRYQQDKRRIIIGINFTDKNHLIPYSIKPIMRSSHSITKYTTIYSHEAIIGYDIKNEIKFCK